MPNIPCFQLLNWKDFFFSCLLWGQTESFWVLVRQNLFFEKIVTDIFHYFDMLLEKTIINQENNCQIND